MYYRHLLMIFLFVGVLAGCNNESLSNSGDGLADSINFPDSKISGARIDLFDGNQMTTEILADRIIEFNDSDSSIAYTLDITNFDSLKQETSIITGDSGIIREQAGFVVIYGNVVVITKDLTFDSLNQESSRITGDSGIIHEQTDESVIYGNVVVITEDSTKLETEVLHWNPETGRIHTDAFVRFTTNDGSILRGWGFEADQRIREYTIFHRVSGETEVTGLSEP
ncbi:MAG: LPS export ABC transporter periplasmic protein LptC [candidate division Zixibacteria bacterium]|nr:LPS export ABC transporter periplasmic protein LptC [candidate division Zixibacteria bacterium]